LANSVNSSHRQVDPTQSPIAHVYAAIRPCLYVLRGDSQEMLSKQFESSFPLILVPTVVPHFEHEPRRGSEGQKVIALAVRVFSRKSETSR
jgi:hypothetical protein